MDRLGHDCTVIHRPTSLLCCTHAKLHSVIWALLLYRVKGIISLLNQGKKTLHVVGTTLERKGTTSSKKGNEAPYSSVVDCQVWGLYDIELFFILFWKHQSVLICAKKQAGPFSSCIVLQSTAFHCPLV